MARFVLLWILFALLTPTSGFSSGDVKPQDSQEETAERAEKDETEEKELTLEELFPEKSFFGPSARNTAFSFDGRYAAWLYRPYIERRHGNDLWLLDTETGESERITSVVVMAEFQEDTRAVKEDREKKARKAGIGKKKDDAEKTVEEDEGDDEEAPPRAEQDDPVSGTWEGRITGGEETGFPPGGQAFALRLILHDDDTVSGKLNVADESLDVSSGRFDRETGEISAVLTDAAGDAAAVLNVTVGEEELSGTVRIDILGITLSIEGKRTKKGLETDEAGNSQDVAVQETVDVSANEQQDQDEVEKSGQDDSKKDGQEKESEKEKEIILGNWVGEDDADDEKAPRYAGIQTYEWSPTAGELIFTSRGDLYRFEVDPATESGHRSRAIRSRSTRFSGGCTITRLTKTQEFERDVQYLPDGSGYTYMNGNSVMKVTFGSHLIEQLDPRLPGEERMIGYELSPDGTRMVFLTRKVLEAGESRTVNIITYRDRFADVRRVPRHVSDDKLEKAETGVYLYDMRDPMREECDLEKVYTHTSTGPRDVLQVPEWAPDSSRIGFAVYTQETGLVGIYQAAFPEEEDEDEGEETDDSDEAPHEEDVDGEGEQNEDEDENEGGEQDEAEDADEERNDEPKIPPAKLVYRFFHHGGPTTPRMIHPYFLADSRCMVFLTEQSGFRHVHILDPMYETLEQVTAGLFEVYPFDISRDHRYLFATATKEHPTREDIYRIDLQERTMVRISREDGVYDSVAVSDDGTRAIATHVAYGQLSELEFIDPANGEQKELTDSHPDIARQLTEPAPEFFTYENRHGQEIHGQMFKPDDWTPQDKRPLLIYVYGGPLGTRKQVIDGSYGSANYFFAYYMAKKHGYVTCTIDPRGVSGYGGLFEKSNFEQVGKPQVEDIVDAVRWLVENHGVDPDRVGIHGWSFGGFQTQMCLYTEPDVFACGIAGAGPTEWENYNSWYSQGTIGQTREGSPDLQKYSLLPLAENLKARLLLVHGMEDANVLYQDTVRVYRELLKAGKEHLVELFLDPTGGHGLGGDVKTLNRYRKYEDFLLRCLGRGEAVQTAETDVAKSGATEAEGGGSR